MMNLLSNQKISSYTSFAACFLWSCCLSLTKVAAQKNSQQKLPIPPNTVCFQDSLFIDKTEIANIHWLEYLHFLEKGLTENKLTRNFYNRQIPDSSITQTKDFNLLTHPAFRYRPVVGIAYEQAVKYCEWRSFIVTEIYNKEHTTPDGWYWQFTFRLPTIKEWEKAAAGNLEISLYPYGLKKLCLVDVKAPVLMRPPPPLMNYRDDKTKRFTLKDIDSYPPNGLGIYQMIGNVAEMTATKGIAKGGSWRNRKEVCKIRRHQRYYAPDNWLGFRCVCEVRLVKKTYYSTRNMFSFE